MILYSNFEDIGLALIDFLYQKIIAKTIFKGAKNAFFELGVFYSNTDFYLPLYSYDKILTMMSNKPTLDLTKSKG